MDDPKKIAAAVTAVYAYLHEEAAALEAARSPRQKAALPPARPNVWGMCGRQDIMQMGTLMQMKTFGR